MLHIEIYLSMLLGMKVTENDWNCGKCGKEYSRGNFSNKNVTVETKITPLPHSKKKMLFTFLSKNTYYYKFRYYIIVYRTQYYWIIACVHYRQIYPFINPEVRIRIWFFFRMFIACLVYITKVYCFSS